MDISNTYKGYIYKNTKYNHNQYNFATIKTHYFEKFELRNIGPTKIMKHKKSKIPILVIMDYDF
jgi:hypothetical protein